MSKKADLFEGRTNAAQLCRAAELSGSERLELYKEAARLEPWFLPAISGIAIHSVSQEPGEPAAAELARLAPANALGPLLQSIRAHRAGDLHLALDYLTRAGDLKLIFYPSSDSSTEAKDTFFVSLQPFHSLIGVLAADLAKAAPHSGKGRAKAAEALLRLALVYSCSHPPDALTALRGINLRIQVINDLALTTHPGSLAFLESTRELLELARKDKDEFLRAVTSQCSEPLDRGEQLRPILQSL